MNLVGIQSDAENDFIEHFTQDNYGWLRMAKYFWIGLSKTEGSWKWQKDGGALSYKNWAPNAAGVSQQACMSVLFGQWYGKHDNKYPFMCKGF